MAFRSKADLQARNGSAMSRSSSSAPAAVLIVEDDPVTRRALSLAIESEPSLKLEAALGTMRSALEWLTTRTADILLTDLGLPDGSGLDIIRACAAQHPACDILVITMSSDEANVLACIEAGAAGYVLKDSGGVDVARAVMDMRAGGAPMSPAIARMVLARVRQGRKAEPPPTVSRGGAPILTKREATILELIARGYTYNEVAQMLSVSVGTVQTHIKNIYGKLSVHSRGEAVFEAHRRGLLQFGAYMTRT
jgi:DNA-binding NarL/FixJ family response regulator